MSEAGKVSLPTPERIQELKGRYEGLQPEDITFMTVGEVVGLLATLEETEQHTYDQNEALIAANELIAELQEQLSGKTEELAESQQQNERLRKNFMFSGSALGEAQQTIARLTKALSFYGSRMCIQPEDVGWNVGFIAREALRKVGEGAKEETFSFPNCPSCNGNRTIAHPSKAGTWLCVPCDKVFEEGSDKA